MEEINKRNEKADEGNDFSSIVVMGKDEYNEFNNVICSRISKIMLFLLGFYSVITIMFRNNEEKGTLLWYSVLVLVLMVYVILITQKRVKDGYKRIVISQGKETITYIINFGEKIVAETDMHAPVEYDYTSVISLKETRKFYLLGMKYNLYFILQKDIKGNFENADFVEYIFNKCSKLKKKKVEKVANKKKICIIYLCLFAVLLIYNVINCFI